LIDYIKALLDKLSKENDQIQAKLRKVWSFQYTLLT
jgi:hypothetical protein